MNLLQSHQLIIRSEDDDHLVDIMGANSFLNIDVEA